MAKPHKIERLYAWISTDGNGEDGIPAVATPGGGMMRLVGSDKVRIESFRDVAMDAVRDGYPTRLVEFTTMIVLEEHPAAPLPGAPGGHQ